MADAAAPPRIPSRSVAGAATGRSRVGPGGGVRAPGGVVRWPPQNTGFEKSPMFSRVIFGVSK